MPTIDPARPATERPLLEEQLRNNLRGVLRKVLKLDRAVARKLGIHATDLSSLQLLQASEEPVTPTGLAHHLGISTGSATAAIDRLERAGFVRRVRSANDRRGVIIELVKAKQERIQASYRQVQERFDRLVADFSDHELQVINRFFQGV
jgi:DNA-binding MarR family transcriptional regulator